MLGSRVLRGAPLARAINLYHIQIQSRKVSIAVLPVFLGQVVGLLQVNLQGQILTQRRSFYSNEFLTGCCFSSIVKNCVDISPYLTSSSRVERSRLEFEVQELFSLSFHAQTKRAKC